jgi:tRNA pseudouridine55 synthase
MDGVLVVDKPAGITSHDAVEVVRRATRFTRIGHTGTLDPLATGVLPLACGRATRLVRFLTASDKAYRATIRFGLTTDTLDVTGTVLSSTALAPAAETVGELLGRMVGKHHQVPPAYSAKKVGGRRAYELARRAQPVDLPPVEVELMHAHLVSLEGCHAVVELVCSAGFYVRVLASTLGEQAGTGACLEALRRTRSGEFAETEAAPLEDIRSNGDVAITRLVPLERLLESWPDVEVDDETRRRVSHGQGVPRTASLGAGAGEWVRVFDRTRRLIAIAKHDHNAGVLHPTVVLI